MCVYTYTQYDVQYMYYISLLHIECMYMYVLYYSTCMYDHNTYVHIQEISDSGRSEIRTISLQRTQLRSQDTHFSL